MTDSPKPEDALQRALDLYPDRMEHHEAAAYPDSRPRAGAQVIDLDAEAWAQIKDAASKSPWIPPQYFMNDWVSAPRPPKVNNECA